MACASKSLSLSRDRPNNWSPKAHHPHRFGHVHTFRYTLRTLIGTFFCEGLWFVAWFGVLGILMIRVAKFGSVDLTFEVRAGFLGGGIILPARDHRTLSRPQVLFAVRSWSIVLGDLLGRWQAQPIRCHHQSSTCFNVPQRRQVYQKFWKKFTNVTFE